MARKPNLPDKETMARIVAYIQAGAFPHVAAAAEGIPSSTYFRWMQAGRQGQKPYLRFWEKVMKAHSQKRVAAEVQVAKENPLAWLRLGPGRTRPGEPGWTNDPAFLPGEEGAEAGADEFTDEELSATITALLDRARTRAAQSAAAADAADGDVGS
jgi:hypothetical protein